MDSQALRQVVLDFANKRRMPLWPTSEDRFVGFVSSRSGRWMLQIGLHDHWIGVRSLFSVNAAPAQQAALMEYITWANYGLPTGRFELDLRDGEIAFCAGLFTADGILTQEMLGCLVDLCLSVADHHLPAILRVLFAGQEPALAFRQTMQPEAAADAGDDTLAHLLDGLEQTLAQLGDPPDD